MKSRGKWSWFYGVALPLAILAYLYTPALVLYYKVKHNVRQNPSFACIPEPLPTSEIAQTASQKFALYGVEFHAPWSGKAQVRESRSLVRIQFQEGQFVLMFDPVQRVDRIKIMHENSRDEKVEKVFGSDAMRSNFALLNTVLNLTPKDISLWMPRIQLTRNCVLLMLKGGELAGTETGLFRFQNERIRGFQKGDPARSPSVVLDAFDYADREYLIFVGRTNGTNGLVRQEDINLILSTLKPRPETAKN